MLYPDKSSIVEPATFLTSMHRCDIWWYPSDSNTGHCYITIADGLGITHKWVIWDNNLDAQASEFHPDIVAFCQAHLNLVT